MALLLTNQAAIFATPLQGLEANLPWSEFFKQAFNLAGLAWERWQKRGLYEVLDYETTLELLDKKGENAIFYKHQKVRYLQDNIIAYQDQAWGEGRILRNYRCAPGKSVDRYQLGHKTIVLISLRDFKQRGDIDEFNIKWEIQNGFRQDQESWETEISHNTRHVRIKIVFPVVRPPLRTVCVEVSRQVTYIIKNDHQTQLPDGRWQVAWEKDRPRVNERFILKWDW